MSKKKHHESKSMYELSRQRETVLAPHSDGIIEFLNRYGLYIICLLALCYVLAYGYTCARKYQSFSYYDYDLAIYNQVTWNTLHGNFMYSSIRENTYDKDGVQKRIGLYFKDHAPVILLFFLPIYEIFQSPLTLLMLQTVFLGAAVIPLYFIAKRELHAGWALTFALIYLLYPPLGYINLFEFHPTCFVPFFLFSAFYFYRLDKYVPFIVFLVLTIFCKEDMSVTVFMFGVYALIDSFRKKAFINRLKWAVVPMAMGLFWAILTFKIIAPMLNAKGYIYGELFKEMGGSIGGIIKTAITRPIYTLKFILKIQSPLFNKPLFLLQIFLPLLFASFLSPLTLLIIVPQLFLYLASSKATPSVIYFQYTAAILPVIFASAVIGVRCIASRFHLRQYWPGAASAIFFFGLLSCVLWGTQFHLFSKDRPFIAANTTDNYDRIYISDHRDEMRQHMADLVPKDASVASMFRFLAKLSGRPRLYSMHPIYSGKEDVTGLKYTVAENIEYALLDFDKSGFFANYETPESYRLMQDFIIGRKYGVEKAIDAFVLLKEGKGDLTPIFEILKEMPSPQNEVRQPIQFTLNGKVFQFIGLIGTDVSLVETDGFRQAAVTSYWQCINEAPKNGTEPAPFNINVVMVLVDSKQPEKPIPTCVRSYPICYEIYPTKIWKKDEIIRNTHFMSIPPDLHAGEYNILLQPIAKDANLQRTMTPIGIVAGSFRIP